jgi:uncharacterized membrane protein YdbT with pleckstrin-like domain
MVRNHPLGFLALVMGPVGVLMAPEMRRPEVAGWLVISPVWLLVWWLRCKTTTLTVTDRQIGLKTGIISRCTNDVFIRDTRNVQIRQGPLQLLLDVGYVGISSSGQSGIEIEVSGLPHPRRIKEIIDSQKFENPLL